MDLFEFHNQTLCKSLQNIARYLMRECVNFGQTCTHGSNLFGTQSNILVGDPCNSLLGKLLQKFLLQCDYHVAHCEHFIQNDFQVSDPSLFIFKELTKLLIKMLHQISITWVCEKFFNPLHASQIILICAPVKSIPLPGTHVLEQKLDQCLVRSIPSCFLLPQKSKTQMASGSIQVGIRMGSNISNASMHS